MTCDHVRERLLEGGPEDRQALTAHLERCPDCRQVAAALDQADRDLRDGLDAVLSRPLAVPTPRRRRFSMAVPALVLATAASFGLALLPVFTDLGWSPSAPSPDEVAEVESLEDDDLATAGWVKRRDALLARFEADADDMGAEDRFRLVVQLGRAAALAGEPVPPFFGRRDGALVNVFYDVALTLDDQAGGTLLATLNDPELVEAVRGARPAQRERLRALRQRIEDASTIPWNALSAADWSERAQKLADGYDDLHDELRPEELARLLAQLGRAAENANDADARFYGEVGGKVVSRPWFALATLEVARPGLLEETVVDTQVRSVVEDLVQRIQSGELPPLSHREAMGR